MYSDAPPPSISRAPLILKKLDVQRMGWCCAISVAAMFDFVFISMVDSFSPRVDDLIPRHFSVLRFRGNAGCIENFLEEVDSVDVNAIDDGCGSSPLHLAAAGGYTECVTALMQAEGIDLGAPDRNGRAPLILAASAGHFEVCTTLLEAGAPYDAVSADGDNCCHLAFRVATSPSSAEAEGEDGGAEAILRAVGDCAGEDAAGFFSTAKSAEGLTVMHLAAAKHDVASLRYLASVGADMSTPDKDGLVPLYHLLPDEDGRECLRLLLEGKSGGGGKGGKEDKGPGKGKDYITVGGSGDEADDEEGEGEPSGGGSSDGAGDE